MIQLTEFDIRLLNLLQAGLPLVPSPYAEIGRQLDCDEQKVTERIGELKNLGIIRRFGAFFDAAHLGYQGYLIAARIQPAMLESVAEAVNRWPQATHNDERDHEYNLWFTIQVREPAEMESLLAELQKMAGVEEMIALPTTDRFKINLKFQMG